MTDAGAVKAERKQRLLELGVDVEEGGHDREALTACDLLVKSPGVPHSAARPMGA